MEIKGYRGGVFLDASFEQGINILNGYSGDGKSFLLSLIAGYCSDNDIDCLYVNGSHLLTSDEIENIAINKKVLLLDNADLYMTKKLYRYLSCLPVIILMSIKNKYYNNINKVNNFYVVYDGKSLSLRKV